MSAKATWSCVEFESERGVDLERAGHTAVVSGSKIYVVGGRKGGRVFYADVLCFDTSLMVVRKLWPISPTTGKQHKQQPDFKARGNHSATLIGREIFVVGGSNHETIFNDLCVFNIDERSWRFPTVRGDPGLLCRSAHGADVHPKHPKSIVIMGGYGGMGSTYEWLNDLLILNTERMSLETIKAQGPSPSPRGYHTLTTLGGHCFVIGGRTAEGRIQGRQMVAVFDAEKNTWLSLPPIDGTAPQARSSHRAVALRDKIVFHGGAASEKNPDKLGDLAVLALSPSVAHMEWSCSSQFLLQGQQQPKGRAAHSASIVATTLYIICGYTGHNSGSDKYIHDCWTLDLRCMMSGGGIAGSGSLRAPSEVPFITKRASGSSEEKARSGPIQLPAARIQNRASTPVDGGSSRSPLVDGGNARSPLSDRVSGEKRNCYSPAPMEAPSAKRQAMERVDEEHYQVTDQDSVREQHHYKRFQLLEVELKHLREERDGLAVQLATTLQSKDERERQYADALARLSELAKSQTKVRDLEQNLAGSETLYAHVSNELLTARDSNAILKQNLFQLETKLEERQRDLESSRQTIAHLQDSISGANKTVEHLQARLLAEEQAAAAAKSALAIHQEQSRAITKDQEAAHDLTRQELRILTVKLANSEEGLTQARSELTTCQRTCKVAEEARTRAEAGKTHLESELATLKHQLQGLRESGRAALEWHRQLEAHVKAGVTGTHGLSSFGSQPL